MRIKIQMAGPEKHVYVEECVLNCRQHVDALIKALIVQRNLIWPEEKK